MNIMVDYFTFISPKLIKCFSNVHETKIKYSKILLKNAISLYNVF